VDLTVSLVELPVSGASAHWSYGTAVVAVPGTSQVILTPPSAASAAPWVLLDTATLTVAVGSGMPGPLRGAVFAPDGRWWVAGLYGVGRLEPGGTKVEDVVRDGLVRYPNRLLPLGDDVVLGSDLSPNVSVLTADPISRMRLARADHAVGVGDRVRVFAPRAGRVYDVDPTTRKVVRRHSVMSGKGGRLLDGRYVYLGSPEVGPTYVRRVDVRSLAEGMPLPAPPGCVEVLGADQAGRLVVSQQDAFVVLDDTTGQELARHEEPRGMVGAGLAAGRNAVVLATTREPLGTVAVVSW
jgi:hypothetical protein